MDDDDDEEEEEEEDQDDDWWWLMMIDFGVKWRKLYSSFLGYVNVSSILQNH